MRHFLPGKIFCSKFNSSNFYRSAKKPEWSLDLIHKKNIMILRYLVIILLIFSIPLALLDYAHFPYSDGAEHGAAIRELAQNFVNPDDPMLEGNYGGSARYVPSVFIMAAFVRLSGLDVLVVIKIFLVIFLWVFIYSVVRFANLYLDKPSGSFCLLVSLLFLWGTGWTGANAYMFSAITYTAYFPSVVSFYLSLLALSFLLKYLQDNGKGNLAWCCILCGIAFVNHPLTGVFLFITSFFLLIEREPSFKRCFVLFFLIIAVSFSFSYLWPYYNFFESFSSIASGVMAQTDDYQMTWEYLHSNRLLGIGPALVSVPLISILMFKRKNLMVTGSFAVFVLVYVFGFFVKASLSERFIFFIVFTLQLTFSLFWASCWCDALRRKKIFFIVTICLAVVFQCYLTVNEFISPVFNFKSKHSLLPEYSTPNKVFKDLKKYLSVEDVVLSDISSSWSVPVYTGAKIIALWHTPPHVKDNFERTEDIKRFYNPTTSNTERKGILEKYGVTHVLLNHHIFGSSNKLIEPQITRLGYPLVVKNSDFSIFAVQHSP